MYMTQGLRRAAKINPGKIALISEKRTFTWAEFQDRVARLAGALHGLGMKVRGSRGDALLSTRTGMRSTTTASSGPARTSCR